MYTKIYKIVYTLYTKLQKNVYMLYTKSHKIVYKVYVRKMGHNNGKQGITPAQAQIFSDD